MTEPIFYVNGKFVPQSRSFVSVYDLGLLRGYGVFDFMRTYNRQPFRLRDHLDRLWNSAEAIGLDLPWNKEDLEKLIYKTLKKNPEGDQSIRIIITGGESLDTTTLGHKPSLIIMVKPAKSYPREFFTEGVKVITFPGKRETPEAKTLNYTHAVKALRKARLDGAEEAIYTYEGLLYECMICSFFVVKNGNIITAGSGVLDSITRRTVLELVKGRVPVEYRCVKVSEIPSLDEAFLASSGREIMPIVAIDQTKIGQGKPGPITKEVMKMFKNYTSQITI